LASLESLVSRKAIVANCTEANQCATTIYITTITQFYIDSSKSFLSVASSFLFLSAKNPALHTGKTRETAVKAKFFSQNQSGYQ
jgi:hypothetical protein